MSRAPLLLRHPHYFFWAAEDFHHWLRGRRKKAFGETLCWVTGGWRETAADDGVCALQEDGAPDGPCGGARHAAHLRHAGVHHALRIRGGLFAPTAMRPVSDTARAKKFRLRRRRV
ncbi:hypothetical protein TraAM80_10433 [Trypanosoma rangeli]|uniref:Uncharacterized protein n=1 Tax=Trypanosoma rangeli TaxID=5698 RepID=A0A3R7N225_TRYRA|nr:uncharacterized protein TraAM80_10433 [Trypanosoma rangeli]RNE95057.1 hypothetical protein TraAM80_10433 [Trypanosoma rangeli]|eukprot:RNE95057.1 hypothetical protein TraAM80_10433 [Trypanosoma rangeli]